jgi:hypothetical protein
MTVIPFDDAPLPRSLAAWPETPDKHPPGDDRRAGGCRALERGTQPRFWPTWEYKVRTTMTTRQTWQYRCCVLRHGKAIKGTFSLISSSTSLRAAEAPTTGRRGRRLHFA